MITHHTAARSLSESAFQRGADAERARIMRILSAHFNALSIKDGKHEEARTIKAILDEVRRSA